MSSAKGGCDKYHVAFAADAMLGHLSPLLPFVEELLARGHSVTFFHHHEPKYRNKIDSCGLSEVVSVTCDLRPANFSKRMMVSGGGVLFDTMVKHYATRRKPDLVVYDFFAVAAADAADSFGCPAICVFPNAAVTINPSLRQSGFIKELIGSLCDFCEACGARIVLGWRNKVRLGRSLPALAEQDIWPCKTMKRLTIGCTGLGLEFPSKAMSPLFAMVGPALPSRTSSLGQTSPELDSWVDQQNLPVVYVAFGTMYTHTEKTVTALRKQLERAEVAVLWSLPKKQQKWLLQVDDNSSLASTAPSKQVKSTWKIVNFAPQLDLLASGKVAAFVSHCGSNSLYEALLSDVPIVAVPGFADQPGNALRLRAAGVGVISKGGINGVADALHEVIGARASLVERSRKLNRVLATFGGAKQAVRIMEDAARVGYEHMIPKATRASWWSRFIICVGIGAGVAAITTVTVVPFPSLYG